jgi:hypothetical protein
MLELVPFTAGVNDLKAKINEKLYTIHQTIVWENRWVFKKHLEKRY